MIHCRRFTSQFVGTLVKKQVGELTYHLAVRNVPCDTNYLDGARLNLHGLVSNRVAE